MAGSQDASDNPVAVNVVPLVDIIFCLCVFFMCSFKFRQLEGKFETWLPKDMGTPDGRDAIVTLPTEVRVALLWDETLARVIHKFGVRTIDDDAELERLIAEGHDAWRQKGRPEAPVTIDADGRVPWSAVTEVVNMAKRRDVANVQFAMGAAPRRGAR